MAARGGISKKAMDRIRDTLSDKPDTDQLNNNNNNNKGDEDIMAKKTNTTNNKGGVNKTKNAEEVSMNQEEVLELGTKTQEEIVAEEQARKEAEEKAKKKQEEKDAKEKKEQEDKLKKELEEKKEKERLEREAEQQRLEDEEFERIQRETKERKEQEEKEKLEREAVEEEKKKTDDYEATKKMKKEIEKKMKELEAKEKNMEDLIKKQEDLLKKLEEQNNTSQEEETEEEEVQEDNNTEDENGGNIEMETKINEMTEFMMENCPKVLRKVAISFDLPADYFESKDGQSIEEMFMKNSDSLAQFISVRIIESSNKKGMSIDKYIKSVFINELKFEKELIDKLENLALKVISKAMISPLTDVLEAEMYDELFDILFPDQKNIVMPDEEMVFMFIEKCYNEFKRILEDDTIGVETAQAIFGSVIANGFFTIGPREEEVKKAKTYKTNLWGDIQRGYDNTVCSIKKGVYNLEQTRVGTSVSSGMEDVRGFFYKIKSVLR